MVMYLSSPTPAGLMGTARIERNLRCKGGQERETCRLNISQMMEGECVVYKSQSVSSKRNVNGALV